MIPHASKLRSLRAELARRHLDGFIVPLADEHMSEYVDRYAQRLGWLTGFKGSAGAAAILRDKAALFVDGRYTAQAHLQIDKREWAIEQLPQTSVAAWLRKHASTGSRVGYDPWLHTAPWVLEARAALTSRAAELVAVDSNPVDAIWEDRPAPSRAKVFVHRDAISGRTSAEKRRDIAAWLSEHDVDEVILCGLDSIAWIFNLRGADVDHTPVFLAYAAVHRDASADLFVAPEKLTEEVVAHLTDAVRLRPRDTFHDYLKLLAGQSVAIDPTRTVGAIVCGLEAIGARVVQVPDPTSLPKAIKNTAEIAGHKAAQIRDGAALVQFLHWLAVEAPQGTVTELSAAARLLQFREQSPMLRGLSFETISSFGPNSAIIHYHATSETDQRLAPGSLYLVDSGAQYEDATTDVTRTIAIGSPVAEMRDRFTRVLKGHIAIARAVFPVGTRGIQLDAFARQSLWGAGLDYAHGTGHGVGSYLGVHEGPQGISRHGIFNEPLAPGMILSNEPGYYKAGEYGIRIENLVLVVEREIALAECQMLGFETLTFAPIDRALIDVSMLTAEECAWVDAYHADVARVLAPRLPPAARAWLNEACSALTRPSLKWSFIDAQ